MGTACEKERKVKTVRDEMVEKSSVFFSVVYSGVLIYMPLFTSLVKFLSANILSLIITPWVDSLEKLKGGLSTFHAGVGLTEQ